MPDQIAAALALIDEMSSGVSPECTDFAERLQAILVPVEQVPTDLRPGMGDRYRRKPTEISALQWDGEADGDAVERIIAMGVEVDFVDFSRTLRIKAGKRGAQGWVDVPEGHWVARAADDDFYPIDPDVFAATYEPVRLDGTTDSDHGIELDGRCAACDPAPTVDQYDTFAAELHATTDARVWARRFMDSFAGRVDAERGASLSAVWVTEDTMLGWFANALETGRDHGRAGYEVLGSEVIRAAGESKRARDIIAEMTKLIRAQDGLLAAYRTGSANRAGKHIDAARAARAQLHEMEVAL